MIFDVNQIIFIVLGTFIISGLLVPLIKKIAFWIGAVAKPNSRSVHKKKMPQLGGLSIFLSFLIGYMFFSKQLPEMNSILIGSFLLILTGIVDDIKPIKARYKLIAQILAAIIVVFYGGLLLNSVSFFGFYLDFGFMSYPITIFFIVGMINIINLIDGLDGLAAGISSIYFLTVGIIAFIVGKSAGLDVFLTFVMLGSTLGFLVHNFYPAKIFMGDTGSMFLGFIISIIALLGFKNVTLTSFLVPIFILGLPVLDTFLAIIRRLKKKQSIAIADKEHLHHRLLKLKVSHRNTVLIMYLITFLLSVSSIIYILKDFKLGIIIYSLVFLIILSLILIVKVFKK